MERELTVPRIIDLPLEQSLATSVKRFLLFLYAVQFVEEISKAKRQTSVCGRREAKSLMGWRRRRDDEGTGRGRTRGRQRPRPAKQRGE